MRQIAVRQAESARGVAVASRRQVGFRRVMFSAVCGVLRWLVSALTLPEPVATASTHRRALLCAGLLSAGRPLSARELSGLLGLAAEDDLRRAVDDLRRSLQETHLGLVLEEVAGGYRLIVDPVLTPDLSALLSPPPLPQLSGAALETLALVAYQQPITRGELEAARGSSCASTLETLQERELIKVVGRKEVVGKPLLYATTIRFLLEFGLKSLDELPPLGETPTDFLRG